jgi:hypothetical protein
MTQPSAVTLESVGSILFLRIIILIQRTMYDQRSVRKRKGLPHKYINFQINLDWLNKQS